MQNQFPSIEKSIVFLGCCAQLFHSFIVRCFYISPIKFDNIVDFLIFILALIIIFVVDKARKEVKTPVCKSSLVSTKGRTDLSRHTKRKVNRKAQI